MRRDALQSSVDSLLENQVLAPAKLMLSDNVDTLIAPDDTVRTHPNMLKGTESNQRVLGLELTVINRVKC